MTGNPLLHRWKEEGPRTRCRTCRQPAYIPLPSGPTRVFDNQECPVRLREKLEELYDPLHAFHMWLIAHEYMSPVHREFLHIFPVFKRSS